MAKPMYMLSLHAEPYIMEIWDRRKNGWNSVLPPSSFKDGKSAVHGLCFNIDFLSTAEFNFILQFYFQQIWLTTYGSEVSTKVRFMQAGSCLDKTFANRFLDKVPILNEQLEFFQAWQSRVFIFGLKCFYIALSQLHQHIVTRCHNWNIGSAFSIWILKSHFTNGLSFFLMWNWLDLL